jgi:hypothetical protein
MADTSPSENGPALEELERRNEQAFARLRQLVCSLREFLRTEKDHDSDHFSGTLSSN